MSRRPDPDRALRRAAPRGTGAATAPCRSSDRFTRADAPDTLDPLSKFKLTIRHGSKVRREGYGTLAEATAALRERAEAIRAEGDLPEVSAFRTYEPGARVHARLEISTGGMLRGRDAGIDVMGDGGLVPYRGGITRRPIEPAAGQSPFEAVAEALGG